MVLIDHHLPQHARAGHSPRVEAELEFAPLQNEPALLLFLLRGCLPDAVALDGDGNPSAVRTTSGVIMKLAVGQRLGYVVEDEICQLKARIAELEKRIAGIESALTRSVREGERFTDGR